MDMETATTYATHLKPTITRIRKVAKPAKQIPEGYVSAKEFDRIFEQKIRAAYENV